MSLYPTKTRLALLRQIANSQVGIDLNADLTHRAVLWPDAPDSWQNQINVTARVQEMERAGWVTLDRAETWWLLTDAGREVLDAAS